MTKHLSLHKVLATLLTLAALFAGQQAFAARKVVTYTITNIELNGNNYDIVFTRSGDAPFDALAPTTYTTSVAKTSIGQSPGYNGSFHVALADGFELGVSWASGSNVSFSNNCIQSGISEKPITYAVSNPNGGYYVTRIVMQGMEYTWDNTTYDFIQPFAHNTSTVRPFGSLTLTYYDAIPEAIGSIPYNRSLETYEINCAQHLNDLASHVNGGNTCAGLMFKMIADIDFEPATAWDDFTSIEENFVRIGHNGAPFQGTFDGDGHTISGIRNGNYLSFYNGLFGLVGSGGTIRNVTLANARIIGLQSIGGIVGGNKGGTVENCHAAHNVVIRVISANAGCCGGIVGENDLSHGAPPSIVTGCTSAAVISMTDVAGCKYFGGIVGKNYEGCTVSNCTAAGVILPSYGVVDYTGAIVGKNDGTLSGNTYHSSLVGTLAFNIGAGRGYVAGTTLDDTKLFLYDDRDNTALINAYVNSSTAYGGTPPTASYLDVTLKGRTLYKDGTWNTLCLPFSFSNLSGTPLDGATIMTLDQDNTAYDSGTGTLTVNFNAVGTSTEITKGKPYIIKWTSGEDVADPTFNYVYRTNMTANTTIVKSSDKYVSLRGTYGPVTPTEGKLFDTHNADNRSFHCYMTLASPTAPEGYAFGGWYTDNALTTPVTTLPFGTDGAFNLYAKFNAVATLAVTGHGESSGWNLIASPMTDTITPTTNNGFLANEYDLFRFNQSATLEWQNYKLHHNDATNPFNALVNGQGYLYANSDNVTLGFVGTPYEGNGKVGLDYDANAEFAGWNLVGNPFLDTVHLNRPFYRMNDSRNELIADSLNGSIAPMEGVFVYTTTANDTVVFSTQPSRAANDVEGSIVIDLCKGDPSTLRQAQGSGTAAVIDRAIVRFGDGQTLPKFQMRQGSTKIYIPQDGKDYAVAVIARRNDEAIQRTEQPIHFKPAEDGTYTLTISSTLNSQLSTLNYLHLIDNITGADIDLLSPAGSPFAKGAGGFGQPVSYTFTARTTDYESRFKLVFSTNQEDGVSTSSTTFAFIDASGNLIVNGMGTLQIFDVHGRALLTKELSTLNSQLSTQNYIPGVYVLRLINGNDVKTQKIIIE